MSVRLSRRFSEERGQALILLVLGMTVMFVIGAITVDVGLWLSERRGSQTDADLSALAGAFKLLDPAASVADVVAEADANLTANDEQGNASFATPVAVDDSCWDQGVNDAVTVDIQHDSRGLFFDIFGLTNPDIGAHAKACVGAANGPGGVLPVQINDNPGPCFDTNEQPVFTALCPLELGSQDNPRGMLDLVASADYCSESGGSGDIAETMENGASGICLINESGACSPARQGGWYDCVAVQTGNPQEVLIGLHSRLVKDGLCDANFGNGDGVDDFSETVDVIVDTGDPFTSLYEGRDCDPDTEGRQVSSRLVTLIILEDEPPLNAGNEGFPIVAFAGFYVSGCADQNQPVASEDDLNRYCESPGARRLDPGPEAYVLALGLGVLPRPNACHKGVTHGPSPVPCPSATATPTPSPTPSPTPAPTDTPAPTPSPTPDTGPPGQAVVYGRFVKIYLAGSDIGRPTDQTTAFGISLVE